MTENALQETEISIAGRTFVLRPTWQLLSRFETATGQPAFTVGQRILGFQASLVEIAAALTIALQDEKDAPTRDQIGEALVEEGFAGVSVPLGRFLTRALEGNKEHARKAAEAAKGGENPQTPPA